MMSGINRFRRAQGCAAFAALALAGTTAWSQAPIKQVQTS